MERNLWCWGCKCSGSFNHLLKQGDTIFSSVDLPCSRRAAVDGKTTAAVPACLCSECQDWCRTFCTLGLSGNGTVIQDPNEILVVQPLYGSNFTVKVHAQKLRSCPTHCNPLDWSPLGSSVHGISQPRILEWVAMPTPRESSPPRGWTPIAGGFFPHWATWEANRDSQ